MARFQLRELSDTPGDRSGRRAGQRLSRIRFYLGVIGWTWLVCLSHGANAQDSVAPLKTSGENLTPIEIQNLVTQLGSSEYSDRFEASEKLKEAGAAAFDALYAVRHTDNLEVRMAATALLSSIRIDWVDANDSLEAKSIMQEYGKLALIHREARLERLAYLLPEERLRLLCRIARFDPSEVIAKSAALKVLSKGIQENENSVTAIQTIRKSLPDSKRASTSLILAFAKGVAGDPDGESELDRHIKNEVETFAAFPESDETRRSLVTSLLRWQAEWKLAHHNRAAALDSIRELITLVDGSREELISLAEWIRVKEAWEMSIELSQRFSAVFASDPLLGYQLANAHAKLGNKDEAERTADSAFVLSDPSAQMHLIVGFRLQEYSMFDWSEREYRKVLELSELTDEENLRARSFLSEMLHDIGKNREAAVILQEIEDGAKENELVRQNLEESFNENWQTLVTRRELFYAYADLENMEYEKAQAHLETGFQSDPTDADILITMFRMPNASDEYKRQTKERIERASGMFRDEMHKRQQLLIESEDATTQQYEQRQLASACNQFAWLVGNTFGDLQEAIRASERSLELLPDVASYLDTLGRCHFAAGNLEKAILHQRRAVELEPYSLGMVKQLKQFEKAYAEQVNQKPKL